MSETRVAIATSKAGMHADADLGPVVAALRDEGLTAEPVPWDAEPATWEGFDLAVVRSTWDYTERLDEFLAWADRTAQVTRLYNPAPMVRWNTDKRYLRHLAERQVAVVPTRFIEPGEQYGPDRFPEHTGLVVKPAVSAGARDTARYEPGRHADAMRHARTLLDQGRVVMVQPYLRLVEEGERALVFVCGEFSHAIRKGPVLTEPGVIDNDRIAHPDVTAYQPTDEERETARAALAAVPSAEAPLFARVDLALDDARKPVVMELELVEPDLFLAHHPDAVRRLAHAVAAKVRRVTP
ncbi:RimK family alpha-L-glutamate ligase [Streptomyces sp. NPDC048603]|uniref:ATP-grasp domain-containing protein n=1 Tax=Streptomyces sp. NPDC048603 TaxID=3365577 RepID=UPI003715C3EE